MRLILLLVTLFPFFCHANVIISATREIYPSDRKEVSVQLLNNGSDPSLVQAWIDDGDPDSTPETARVPFLLMPPVAKVPAHSGQQLKIRYMGGTLPTDRESVFYLNVLDIPPVPENLKGKSVMQLAIRSRIKLFFRPAGLKIAPKNMIDNVTLTQQNDSIILHNATPYYFTLSGVAINKTGNILKNGLMVSPFSQRSLKISKTLSSGTPITLVYINDYGASIESKKKIQ